MQQSCMHPQQNLTDALASVALVWIQPCKIFLNTELTIQVIHDIT